MTEQEKSHLPLRWADGAQFNAESFDQDEDLMGTHGVIPKVSLIWMTPDPLGALASYNEMYEGNVIRSMDDVDDEMRMKALTNIQKTHLQAPLENIKIQFLLEGVDRAFTHQLVRQRTAVFAQESMRFAVLGDLLDATTLPPSLQGTSRSSEDSISDFESDLNKQRKKWDDVIRHIDKAYHELVDAGMAAEDARGLLPHATATRIQFTTDFRNLIAHSGNRLCTQAQFHWRAVFSQMVAEIGNHAAAEGVNGGHDWQYKAIANSGMFKPACYQLGHCPFKASFDRPCSIRSRVDTFSSMGISSDKWGDQDYLDQCGETAIKTSEWLLKPDAARIPL